MGAMEVEMCKHDRFDSAALHFVISIHTAITTTISLEQLDTDAIYQRHYHYLNIYDYARR